MVDRCRFCKTEPNKTDGRMCFSDDEAFGCPWLQGEERKVLKRIQPLHAPKMITHPDQLH